MKYLTSVLSLIVLTSVVQAQQFTVVNKCDCSVQFTVVNKVKERSYSGGTKTFFAFRSPRGHTHTCSNGHTWDHDANPTHKCQFCGVSQFVQDRVSRPVTVERTVQTTTVTQPTHTYDHSPTHSSIYSIPGVSSGGCANGQCATPQTSKFRLFR